jgi:lysophospholipase L1-like esterase
VKGLDQLKLSRATIQNIGIQCFPGATVQDMKDYIKPILRRNTDTIVLHVGTNDVKGNKASKVMDDIDSLCQEIKETNPGVEITLSELTTREDNPEAKKTVTEVNTLFENYCTATNMYLIKHKNITDRSLNKSNLHLNKFGSACFAKNFIQFFNHCF